MLTVACVQYRNYLGRGREYVDKFYNGVRKHMPAGVEWRGACFTDDPSTLPEGIEAKPVPDHLTGWWSKLVMFRDGSFAHGERVLFGDLDVIPVGDLEDLAGYRGAIAGVKDPFHPERFGSSVMAWEAGRFGHIWSRFESAGMPQFDQRGDQFWIETMQPEAERFDDLFPGQVVSFKAHCWLQGKIPANARIVFFHGHPRPHECVAPFIKELWTPGWKQPEPVHLDWGLPKAG